MLCWIKAGMLSILQDCMLNVFYLILLLEKLFGEYMLMQWQEKKHLYIFLLWWDSAFQTFLHGLMFDDKRFILLQFIFSCKLPVLSYLPPDKCERQESKAGHCNHFSSWSMLRLLSKINTKFLNVNISWGEESVSVIMSWKKMEWLLVNIWSPLYGFSMMSDFSVLSRFIPCGHEIS